MIEPQQLPGPRVLRQGRAHGAGAQAVALLPFDLDAALAAMLLDRSLVLSLKDGLPAEAEAVSEIAHVHSAQRGEAVANRGIDVRQDAAAVRDRRLPSYNRRLLAEEKDLQRPHALVRVLVM